MATFFSALFLYAPFYIGPPMVMRVFRARGSSRIFAGISVLVSCVVGLLVVSDPLGIEWGSVIRTTYYAPMMVASPIIGLWLASALPQKHGGRWIDGAVIGLFVLTFALILPISASVMHLD